MQLRARRALHQWYQDHSRPLPWRTSGDPYCIWLSETMLQQTTIQVVLPYYEKFLSLFPTLEDLATAPESQVLAAWAGLGYYSRARNLHKAAKALSQLGYFPKTYSELLQLPGFGPYTSRAVSSIAFNESVGVLDGNVIRVLSRYHALALEWWKTKPRATLQEKADNVVQDFPPGEMNQALMDLGSTICTSTRPACPICPINKSCQACQQDSCLDFPLKKSRKAREIWQWQPQVWRKRGKIALFWNEGKIPFLKNHWILPGSAKQLDNKPKQYSFRHSITHHDIFVVPQRKKGTSTPKSWRWVPEGEISQWIPASLIKKTLEQTDKKLPSLRT